MNFFDLDTIKVGLAGMLGFLTQLSNMDLVFKVVVGLFTSIYIAMKMFDWITDKLEKRRNRKTVN